VLWARQTSGMDYYGSGCAICGWNGDSILNYMARHSIVPGSNWLVQSSGWDKIWPVVHNYKSMYNIHQMSVTSICCWNMTEPSRIWAQGQTAGRLLSQIKHVMICHLFEFQLSSHPTSLSTPTLSFKVSACSGFLFLFCSQLFGNIYGCGWPASAEDVHVGLSWFISLS
jgi:hypothetical protein